MYDITETEKMRSKRISGVKDFQHVEFTNKILLNNNIGNVHTSNRIHYDGMKTIQEPSPWLDHFTKATVINKTDTSYHLAFI